MMMKEFTIYTSRKGEKFIQTKNFRLAESIAYLTGARYYKLPIKGELVLSFQYSDGLMNAIEVIDGLRLA